MILSIYICEDDDRQRQYMEKIITRHADLRKYDIKLVLSTGSPAVLLSHLAAQTVPNTLYFLDIDLQHEMNGIALAKEIREHDLHGKIVFVTTHAELSHVTFRYRIEAMDYIIKDPPEDMEKGVCECVDLAYSRYREAVSEKEYFQVKSTVGIQHIPLDEIMYFEANHAVSHKLILHTYNGRVEFRGTLKDVETISPDFFRCNKSYVVNTKNIKRVKRVQKIGEAEMKNGKIVPVGEPKIAALIRIIAG